jgi:cellulose biosynthesis protein BcsQ
MSQTPVLPPNERRILRLDEVEAKSGFKRAHIYNLMKKRSSRRRCAWVCAPSAGIPSKSISGSPSASTTGPDPFSRGPSILTRRTPCRLYPSFQPKVGSARPPRPRTWAGSFADAGLRVLLLDLDVQPTLSSYYELAHRAPGGIYELLAFNERDLGQLGVPHDHHGPGPGAVQRPPGRAEHLAAARAGRAPAAAPSAAGPGPLYDLVLIDTQGARSVLLEMAVLASDLALSPVTPEILAARELRRGTMQLLEDIAPYRHLGIEPPPLHLLINRVHPVSANARLIQQACATCSRTTPASACWPPTCRPSKPIRAPRRAACRCIGSNTASPGQSRPRRARHHARPRRRTVSAVAASICRCVRPSATLLRPGGPMANAHELARGHKRLRALIEFAVGEGWHVKRTRAATSNSPRQAAPRSTPVRRPATTGQPSTPVRRSAAPSARPDPQRRGASHG